MSHLVPVFLEVALGLGSVREAPPELTDPSPALAGHVAIGARPIRYLALAVAGSLARATFANVLPPPAGVTPDDRMTVSRLGLGLSADLIAPAGPVELWVGVAGYLYRTTEAAEGRSTLIGISGEYATFEDTSAGYELEVGIAASPWRCGRGGLRAFAAANRPRLAGAGEVELRVVGIELFVQTDLAGSPAAAAGAAAGCGVSSGGAR